MRNQDFPRGEVFESISGWVREVRLYRKIYFLGAVFVLCPALFMRSLPPYIVSPLLSLGVLIWAVGFVVWIWPAVRNVWSRDFGKLALTALNFFVLLVTTVLARGFVSESLGFPPQDFDLTVGFCIFFLYIPCLALLMALVTAAVALAIFLLVYVSLVVPIGRSKDVLAHFFGALAFCFSCAIIFDFANRNEPYAREAIRFVAFVADFQPAPNYPGVEINERIRLLENGVIAIASVVDGKVSLSYREYGHKQ